MPTLVHGDIVMFDSCAILPLCDLSIFLQPIMLQLTINFAATWKNRNLSDFLKKTISKDICTLLRPQPFIWKNVIYDLFGPFFDKSGSHLMLYLLDQFDVEHKLAPKDPEFRAKFYKLMFYCRWHRNYQ